MIISRQEEQLEMRGLSSWIEAVVVQGLVVNVNKKSTRVLSLRLPGCVPLAPVRLLPSLHFITYLHELKSYPPYPLSQRLERAATPSEPRNTNGISPKTSSDFTHNKRPVTGLELAYLQ